MKMISRILLGAMLLTSGTVMAQGKSGKNKGNNGHNETEVHSSTGIISANEHASANGQLHASDRSILNRPATTVRVNNGKRRYYYKNGKRYTSRNYYGTRRYARKAE